VGREGTFKIELFERYREILGLKVGFSETGEGWRALFSDLKARELSGVEMITSDAHEELRGAIQRCFPGAIGQRCHTEEFLRVYFRRSVTDWVPAAKKRRVHQMLDNILEAAKLRGCAWGAKAGHRSLRRRPRLRLKSLRTALRTQQPRWRHAGGEGPLYAGG